MTVDGFFGIRITDNDGFFRQDPVDRTAVAGDVLLGGMTVNPDALGANGPGTIVKFDNQGAPLFFRLGDGTGYRGFIQCFSRDELLGLPALVNEVPSGGGELLLTFRVTSATGAGTGEPRIQEGEVPQEARRSLSVPALFSVLPVSRIMNILSSLPRSAAAWLLKSAAGQASEGRLFDFCLSLPEEERGDFLGTFISCRPSVTPPSVRRVLLSQIASSLDPEELAAAESAAGEGKAEPAPDADPVISAAGIINRLGEHEKRLVFEWLITAGSGLSDKLREWVFLFEDIRLLSDINIQKLLREVDTRDLAAAVSGEDVSEDLVSAVRRNMSERAWGLLQDEIGFNKDLPDSRRFEARGRIVGILARMEENGSIVI